MPCKTPVDFTVSSEYIPFVFLLLLLWHNRPVAITSHKIIAHLCGRPFLNLTFLSSVTIDMLLTMVFLFLFPEDRMLHKVFNIKIITQAFQWTAALCQSIFGTFAMLITYFLVGKSCDAKHDGDGDDSLRGGSDDRHLSLEHLKRVIYAQKCHQRDTDTWVTHVRYTSRQGICYFCGAEVSYLVIAKICWYPV